MLSKRDSGVFSYEKCDTHLKAFEEIAKNIAANDRITDKNDIHYLAVMYEIVIMSEIFTPYSPKEQGDKSAAYTLKSYSENMENLLIAYGFLPPGFSPILTPPREPAFTELIKSLKIVRNISADHVIRLGEEELKESITSTIKDLLNFSNLSHPKKITTSNIKNVSNKFDLIREKQIHPSERFSLICSSLKRIIELKTTFKEAEDNESRLTIFHAISMLYIAIGDNAKYLNDLKKIDKAEDKTIQLYLRDAISTRNESAHSNPMRDDIPLDPRVMGRESTSVNKLININDQIFLDEMRKFLPRFATLIEKRNYTIDEDKYLITPPIQQSISSATPESVVILSAKHDDRFLPSQKITAILPYRSTNTIKPLVDYESDESNATSDSAVSATVNTTVILNPLKEKSPLNTKSASEDFKNLVHDSSHSEITAITRASITSSLDMTKASSPNRDNTEKQRREKIHNQSNRFKLSSDNPANESQLKEHRSRKNPRIGSPPKPPSPGSQSPGR